MKRERFTLIFSPESYSKPITYYLVKNFDLRINILRAEVTPGEEGHLLMELEGEDENILQALQFLQDEQIKAIPANKQIAVNKDDCIHCGACTAVCFSGAIVMNRETWQTEFHPEDCIVCGLCINACPLRIISIGFGSDLDG